MWPKAKLVLVIVGLTAYTVGAWALMAYVVVYVSKCTLE